MYKRRDWTHLGQLLALQPHRLSPEQLRETVKDLQEVANILKGSIGLVGQNDLRIYVRDWQEACSNVKENWWDKDRVERQTQRETYRHDPETLKEVKQKISDASKTIFNSIFPDSNIQDHPQLELTYEQMHPEIRRILIGVTSKYGGVFIDQAEEDYLFFVFLAEQAASLHFFAEKGYFPYVLPDNPYSIEKHNEEAAKQHYEKAKEEMSESISEVQELLKQKDPNWKEIYIKLDSILIKLETEHDHYKEAFGNVAKGFYRQLKKRSFIRKANEYEKRIPEVVEKIGEITGIGIQKKSKFRSNFKSSSLTTIIGWI